MSDGLCHCPLLEMAAAQERMITAGILPAGSDHALHNRITAIIVGQLRSERGCTGPDSQFAHVCRYYYETSSGTLETDPNVPLLKRPFKDGQDKKYI